MGFDFALPLLTSLLRFFAGILVLSLNGLVPNL